MGFITLSLFPASIWRSFRAWPSGWLASYHGNDDRDYYLFSHAQPVTPSLSKVRRLLIARSLWCASSISGKLLDRGYAAMNTVAATAFLILLVDSSSVEDSSFQMTFAAVAAVIGLGVPASHWTLGWLRDALKDFNDSSKDAYLSIRAVDWRIARRVWCELHGLPTWILTIPWRILLAVGEAAIVSICVEMVFLPFMVESFHRFSPVSPLLNIPAGLIATAVVTPLGLLLILLPAPFSGIVSLEHHTTPCRVTPHPRPGRFGCLARHYGSPHCRSGFGRVYISAVLFLAFAIRKRWTATSSGTLGLVAPAARRHCIGRLFAHDRRMT